MGDNREIWTAISNCLRERLGTYIALYRKKTKAAASKQHCEVLKSCSFNEYQVTSRRSFTEKTARCVWSGGVGGGGCKK